MLEFDFLMRVTQKPERDIPLPNFCNLSGAYGVSGR